LPEEKMGKWCFSLFGLVALVFACSPVISRQSLKEVDPTVTFQELLKDPERYKGKLFLLGGQIVTTTIRDGETWVEVLQQPLNWQERPEDTDLSYGRFLVRFLDFRDPAIYTAGRKITVAGEVQGKKVLPLKQIEYNYPVLIPRESYLWRPEAGGGPFFHIGIGVGGMIR
jgi:outer membrane lipoprotein